MASADGNEDAAGAVALADVAEHPIDLRIDERRVLEASVDENAGLEKLQGYLKQLTTLPWGEAEPRSQFRVSAPPPAVELVDQSART